MAFENFTINEFKLAKFKGDYSVISEDVLKIVYDEFIDTSGLYSKDEFQKVGYIYYLNGRINSLKLSIKLQKSFLDNFDIPFIEEFKMFKKYGHILYWNNDKKAFLKSLDLVEEREKKFVSQLENKSKELIESRLKKVKKEETVDLSRSSFIRNVNNLGKQGWKVYNDKTTMEELAYMIKDQIEESKKL